MIITYIVGADLGYIDGEPYPVRSVKQLADQLTRESTQIYNVRYGRPWRSTLHPLIGGGEMFEGEWIGKVPGQLIWNLV